MGVAAVTAGQAPQQARPPVFGTIGSAGRSAGPTRVATAVPGATARDTVGSAIPERVIMAEARDTCVRARFPDFWFEVGSQEYALDAPQSITSEACAEILRAADDATRVFAAVVPIIAALPSYELHAIGIPARAVNACRTLGGSVPTVLGRFDFAMTADGPKVLEFNADTPFFMWETFEIAGALVRARGLCDPNVGALDVLRAAIVRVCATLRPQERLAVCAYNTWREDWFSAKFLARVASEALGREVDCVPLHELRVDELGCYDARGTRIDVLWRLYPLEHLAHDPAAGVFFDRLADGSVRTINPPHALLAQTKAALAIAWGLRDSDVLDSATRGRIKRLFLPTYLDVPDDGTRYVRKPVLGREGRGVAIVDAQSVLESARSAKHPVAYERQPVVYQKYVELPRVHISLPRIPAHFDRAIVTCFVADGTPCGIGMRVGGAVTDASAVMVPLAVR